MQERTLRRSAYILILCGLIGLFFLSTRPIPLLEANQSIATSQLISFPAKITQVHQTDAGTVLTLERSQELLAFFPAQNTSISRGEAQITGVFDGEWFQVKQITFLEIQ